MFVYADRINKTCQIIEVHSILDAILHVKNGKGTIYFASEKEGDNRYELTEDEMADAIVWRDGYLTNLGKTFIDYSNLRNVID